MSGSFRLGKIRGIDLYVNLSWLIILVLLTWSLANDWFAQIFPGWTSEAYWLIASISAFLLFLCVLAHEMAHAYIASKHGLRVKSITLFIFGGIAELEREPEHPATELRIALTGPAASLLLAGLAFLLALPLRATNSAELAVLDYLVVSNLVLALLNLLPGFPLDGGRVLRALLWHRSGDFARATSITSLIGQGCGILFILIGIVIFFVGDFFDGLWLVFIGWFLSSAAQSASILPFLRPALDGIQVQEVMNREPVSAPGNISLQKLVNDYFQPHHLTAIPITHGSYLSGLITLSDIGQVPPERWAVTPVGYVMRMRDQLYTVAPDATLNEVLQVMVQKEINQVPVVLDDVLVGLVSRDSIMRYLQTRQKQRPGQPELATR